MIEAVQIMKLVSTAAGMWVLGFSVGKTMAYVRALVNAG